MPSTKKTPSTKSPSKNATTSRRTSPTPRLKPGILRAVRSDGVFIGTRERGVLLRGSGVAAVTDMLDGEHTRLDISVATGTPTNTVEEILVNLAAASLIDRDPAAAPFTPAIAERMAPELSAAAHRPGVSDGGSEIMQRRERAVVDLYGLGRVGMSVAGILAASGVSALRVIDEQAITTCDVIGSAVRMSDVGGERQMTSAVIIRDACPTEARRPDRVADLAILTSYPTPESVALLTSADRPYLVVECTPDEVSVGPLVIPGQGACLRCIALHRTDADREWGQVEMAHLATFQRFIPAAAIASAAASIAALQALAFIDTGAATALGRTIHLNIHDGVTRLRSWARHPLCGCGWGQMM
jgi:hypothetical protein